MADRMSLTTADTREILFDVEGYAATKEMAGDCEYFESEVFSVGGYDWAVRYYPPCVDPFISIVLVLHNKPTDDHGSYVFSRCGEEKGFWEYAAEAPALKDPGFLVGDCFTLSCTVSVLKKPHQATWHVSASSS